MNVYTCIFVGLESRLRETSRQLSLSELSREQLNSELESLKLQVQNGHHWETEKQVTLCVHVHCVHVCIHVHVYVDNGLKCSIMIEKNTCVYIAYVVQLYTLYIVTWKKVCTEQTKQTVDSWLALIMEPHVCLAAVRLPRLTCTYHRQA